MVRTCELLEHIKLNLIICYHLNKYTLGWMYTGFQVYNDVKEYGIIYICVCMHVCVRACVC